VKHIGFSGGGSMFELGSVSDMQCFFSVIEKNKEKLQEPHLFLDRLYRRYVRFDELDAVETMMPSLRDIFSAIRTDESVLRKLGWQKEETMRDLSQKNLLDFFSRYFEAIEHCICMARLVHADHDEYIPLRTGVVDIPFFIYDKMRSLSEYDALGPDDPPFWLR
jgi:hypothetical protein